jgi:hypothetical protein
MGVFLCKIAVRPSEKIGLQKNAKQLRAAQITLHAEQKAFSTFPKAA